MENKFDLPKMETPRLILRKISINDVKDMFEYSSNAEVTKYLSYTHKNIEEAVEYIENKEKAYKEGKCMLWGIEHKDNKKYIGAVGFTHHDSIHNVGEIAYTLSREYWKIGLGYEAVKRIIDFGFENMNLNRIQARCWEENTNSSGLMERLDMKYEGLLREQIFIKGLYRNVKIYSLLKSEIKKG